MTEYYMVDQRGYKRYRDLNFGDAYKDSKGNFFIKIGERESIQLPEKTAVKFNYHEDLYVDCVDYVMLETKKPNYDG